MNAEEAAALSAILEEFSADFNHAAIVEESRRRLAPLISRWGSGRLSQILSLWTFLGDGSFRPVSTSALQVWGPPGTGKSTIISDYLKELGIQHIRLNCAAFTSLGELSGRMVELLQGKAAALAGDKVAELQLAVAPGVPVRSIDKMETLTRVPLQILAQTPTPQGLSSSQAGKASEGTVKMVVVLDQSQEIQSRFGAGALDLLTNLPEVLQWGNQLAVVTIGQLRLSSLGMHPNREPPAVAFQAYTEAEAKTALETTVTKEFGWLFKLMANSRPAPSTESAASAPSAVAEPIVEGGSTASSSSSTRRVPYSEESFCNGLVRFAWAQFGRNLTQLLSVARQLLNEGQENPLPEEGPFSGAFQERVQSCVQHRLGLCDISGLLNKKGQDQGMEAASVAAVITTQQMTRAEMRLILSAYLAGYVEKEDDVQLFMPELRRKGRRINKSNKPQDALPVWTRPPKATSISRLLAVYHRLARRPQLLGPPIMEHLSALREAGFLRFPADRSCLDQDVKVTCRAQLPLIRAICAELSIDLAEYLTKY